MAKRKRKRITLSASGHPYKEYKLGDMVKYNDRDYTINGKDDNKKELHLVLPNRTENHWVPFAQCKLLPF